MVCGEVVIFVPLKDRLNPPEPITIFTRDKTTDVLKNQILGIVSKYYHPRRNSNFSISLYYKTIIESYSISKSLSPISPDSYYSESAVFDYLNDCTDYDFFEFLDCIIFTLYSDPNIRFMPDFKEFISDINCSLKNNGIDYVVIEGNLEYRTEEIIIDSAITPCMLSLQRHALVDADNYLLNAFKSYKKGDNNEAILFAVKSLENVVQRIIEIKKIDCGLNNKKLQDKIPLLLKGTNSEFLSNKMIDQYLQMDRIFQVAMSSRNEVSHGSNRYQADEALVEHTINIVQAR